MTHYSVIHQLQQMYFPVHAILAASHILFLPAFHQVALCLHAGYQLHVVTLFLLINVVFWSTLMHLSETKKGLLPANPCLVRYSNVFLNFDRLFAVTASVYGCLFLGLSHHTSKLFKLFFIGFLFSALGEWFGARWKWIPYVVLHLIWHGLVAYIAYQSIVISCNPSLTS